LYEVGGVEIVFALCLACLYGLLTLLLPPWPSARQLTEEVLSHPEAEHHYLQQQQQQDHQEHVPEQFQQHHQLQYQPPPPPPPLSQWRVGGRSKRRRRLAIDTYRLEAKNGCHAKLLISSNLSSCCPICLHNFAEGDKVTEGRHCKHVFHHDCLAVWLCKSPSCPYCRHDLEVSDSEDAGKLEESHKTGIWNIFDGVLDSIYT
jgi:Ring finger domain